jgi:putative Mg2+ transporter-C (MgtC) family protein
MPQPPRSECRCVHKGRTGDLLQRRARAASALAAVVVDVDFLPGWSPAHIDMEQPETAEPRARIAPVVETTLRSPSIALEVRVLVRLLVAVVVGGIIGVERRTANSLAGVRTFSLVSLGASMFMSTALVGFPQSDPVRFGAAISTSVGFLGAGAMHQGRTYRKGMTTAAGIWLAAALGIAAAAGMFLVAFTGSIATVLISRYLRFDSSLHLIRYDDNPVMEAPEFLSSARAPPVKPFDIDEPKAPQYRRNSMTMNGNGVNTVEEQTSPPRTTSQEVGNNGVHVPATDDTQG